MMNFGDALSELKLGKRVAREGWNGKNMFIILHQGFSSFNDTNLEMMPFFAIKTVGGYFNTWVPSVSDLLANDWFID